MKNIFFYLMAALGFLFNPTKAAENLPTEDWIPFHVTNEPWPKKTELTGIITYKNKEEKEFSIIFDKIAKVQTQKSINLPRRTIEKIDLYLFNYYYDGEYYYEDGKQLQGTLLAQTVFKPSDLSLKEITVTIKGKEIISNPIYNLPPSLMIAGKPALAD